MVFLKECFENVNLKKNQQMTKKIKNFPECKALKGDFISTDVNERTSIKSLNQHRPFNTGDLVWGQIRGFPSWPGKLVDMEYKLGELEDGRVTP